MRNSSGNTIGSHRKLDARIARAFALVQLSVALLPCESVAQSVLDYRYEGSEPEARLGSSIATGDIDGYGKVDMLVGAPSDPPGVYASASAGYALLVSGKDGKIAFQWRGLQPDDEFGAAVAIAGDWNQDGVLDLAIGAPGGGFYLGDDKDRGEVRIVSGKDGAVVRDIGGYEYAPSASLDRFGSAIAGIGDQDGDGFPEILIGDPWYGSDAGSVFVVNGRLGVPTDQVAVGSGGDLLGAAVACAGFVDGDARMDFVVGAPGRDGVQFNSGQATLFAKGAFYSTLRSWSGAEQGAALGDALASGFDVTGDQRQEILIGASYRFASSKPGKAYCMNSATGQTVATFLGASNGDEFGRAVAFAGFVDGDAIPDAVIGAPGGDNGATTNSGLATIHSATGGAPMLTIAGPGPDARLGTAVASLGDVNADGSADLALGIPNYHSPFANAGRAGVYSGKTGLPGGAAAPPTVSPGTINAGHVVAALRGDSAKDHYGAAIASGGDLDDDGVTDFLIGSPGDFDAKSTGSVHVVSGKSRSVIFEIQGEFTPRVTGEYPMTYNSKPGFGASVASVGDCDQDGVPDFLVGCPSGGHFLDDEENGTATLISGRTGLVLEFLYGRAFDGYGAQFGTRVCGLGDRDLDGFPEIAVSAPVHQITDDDGAVFVFRTATFANDAGKVFQFSSAPQDQLMMLTLGAQSGFGWSMASAGDLDGDGALDLLVGTPEWVNEFQTPTYGVWGGVRVYSGSGLSDTVDLPGDFQYWRYGASVAGLGDVDGDQIADFAIGAPEAGEDGEAEIGLVEIRSLAAGKSVVRRRFFGAVHGEHFGEAISSAGDLDGDGLNDVLIGVPSWKGPGGANIGRAIVVSAVSGKTLLELKGTTAGQFQGETVAPIGDLDGDAVPEVAVGAPDYSDLGERMGIARVYSAAPGPNSGVTALPPIPEIPDDGDTTKILDFATTGLGSRFGASVALVGDLDSDGHSEFAVGEPFFDDPISLATGRVTIYSGATRLPIQFVSPTADDRLFGYSIAGVGDLDLDGALDVAIGAPESVAFDFIENHYSYGDFSSATVIFGGKTRRRYALDDSEGLGHSVSAAGDMNGDGFADFVVGAPRTGWEGGAHGRALVFTGRSGMKQQSKWAGVLPVVLSSGMTTGSDVFGYAVTGGGDVDGDGLDDLVVSSPVLNDPVEWYCYSRVDVIAGDDQNAFTYIDTIKSCAEDYGQRFGGSLAIVGDIDGDGGEEIAIGSFPDGDEETGCVWIRSPLEKDMLGAIFGEHKGDSFGCAVSRAGKLDADDVPDIWIAAPTGVGKSPTSGRVRAYSLKTGEVIRNIEGVAIGERFGNSIAGGRDVDGDEHPDLLVGAPLADTPGANSGAARLYMGVDPQPGNHFRPGDRLVGRIESADDSHAVKFEGLGGMKLVMKVTSVEGDLRPEVTVRSDGGSFSKSKQFDSDANVKQWSVALPADGTYVVEVAGDDATTGLFWVETGVKYPSSGTKQTKKVKPSGDVLVATLAVFEGGTIHAILKPPASKVAAGSVSISAGGVSIDASGFVFTSDDAIAIDGLPAPVNGTYTIRLEPPPESLSTWKFTLDPIQPALGKAAIWIND